MPDPLPSQQTLGCYFEKKSGRSGPDGPHFVELGAYGLG
jgi:hypothetical protein